MRLTNSTRFPHPTLSPESNDFGNCRFSVLFGEMTVDARNAVHLGFQAELDQPNVHRLLDDGIARLGTFVHCKDTYFSSLERMAWPTGSIEFRKGSLLNRVVLRPIVWLSQGIEQWRPQGLDPELPDAWDLPAGSIIAFGPETELSVGRTKLAPLESIFNLSKSEAMDPDMIEVKLDSDYITILAGVRAFQSASGLRSRSKTRAVALGAVYLPAVMDVLDQLRANAEQFEERRWFEPFRARCDRLGIRLDALDPLEHAQKLLGQPLPKLQPLVEAD